ncbi:arginine N-succinyltransferase [Thorsellia anophelis]|uniref:Arginine N-succinyltransferase n=1 Tax=Thorsellia anophelis DSM 18579 TaxID=1123402 RepID=A0A1I0C101_9GAMM|nr:arginine N-succinyltransferase [Thorsellia anophelis]SET12417.1 arginine N-succinyltransferase [Thorsellia anophelis DSM 18579]
MIIIRPVRKMDIDDILSLSTHTGGGLTSLPHDRETLEKRIIRSKDTWLELLEPDSQGYVFVMEDLSISKVVGICAIEVAVGLREPWYSYRITQEVHASKALDVYRSLSTLVLSNDHTGFSELCTLFLSPEYRKGVLGRLLSKSRFLFIASNRKRFPKDIIAELRGYSNKYGHSPFWEHVGKHFFAMDFEKVDFLSGTGQKAFIAELMPKHPLYVDFLPAEAKSIIGQVHPETAPARKMLEGEGLKFKNYIDIFDGGPTLQSKIDKVYSIKNSRLFDWQSDDDIPLYDYNTPANTFPTNETKYRLYLVSNEQLSVECYKVTVSFAYIDDSNKLNLPVRVIDALNLKVGEPVRAVLLK